MPPHSLNSVTSEPIHGCSRHFGRFGPGSAETGPAEISPSLPRPKVCQDFFLFPKFSSTMARPKEDRPPNFGISARFGPVRTPTLCTPKTASADECFGVGKVAPRHVCKVEHVKRVVAWRGCAPGKSVVGPEKARFCPKTAFGRFGRSGPLF